VLACDFVFTPAPRALATHVILQASHRDTEEPTARICWNAGGRPLHCRSDQRFLNCILGVGEIAAFPRDDAEHLRRKLAQQALGGFIDARGCAPRRT
jgi:hypothetical protein